MDKGATSAQSARPLRDGVHHKMIERGKWEGLPDHIVWSALVLKRELQEASARRW